jgi:Domain of unknown function (DUF4126)
LSPELIGMAGGMAFAAGLNLYATVATVGLLGRLGVVTLPPALLPLAHPVVLGIAIALYVVEFFADKIPYLDNVWDLIHTFIRPPAAAILAFAALGPVPAPWRIAAALLAGGVALTAHSTKAAGRAAVNTSPEPVSNSLVSAAEDLLAIGLAWLAAAHPLVALGAAAALLIVAIWALVLLFRVLRRVYSRPGRRTVPS